MFWDEKITKLRIELNNDTDNVELVYNGIELPLQHCYRTELNPY